MRASERPTVQVDPLSVLGDSGDVLVYALPKSRPPHVHLPPAAPPYTTSTDVDVPCKNEFLFSFFFRSHFPLGTVILSLRLLRPSPDDNVKYKRQREHARVYIYMHASLVTAVVARVATVDAWRRGTEDFVEEKSREDYSIGWQEESTPPFIPAAAWEASGTI